MCAENRHPATRTSDVFLEVGKRWFALVTAALPESPLFISSTAQASAFPPLATPTTTQSRTAGCLRRPAPGLLDRLQPAGVTITFLLRPLK